MRSSLSISRNAQQIEVLQQAAQSGGLRCILEINDEAKQIVHELGTAINTAVEQSSQVAAAIARLREAGYEMELTLRLEIALREQDAEEASEEEAALELTDEDLRTLRRMKIRIDAEE